MSDSARARAELFDEVLFPTVSSGGLDGIVQKSRDLVKAQEGEAWPHFVLGLALGMRYLDGKDDADAEAGVHHMEEAIRLGGTKDPEAAMYRQQLAGTLGARWAHAFAENPKTDPAELSGALRLAREALEMTPPDSPHLPVRLVQVAEFLGQGAGDISEALALTERALAVADADDPRRSKFQHTHAQLLLRLAADDEGDASTAVSAEKSAIKAAHAVHPYDPAQVGILGTIQRARLLSAG